MITHTSGGDPIPAGIEIGLFEVDSDSYTATVNHSLGAIPKIAFCVCAVNGDYATKWQSGSPMICELLGASPLNGDFQDSYGIAQKLNSVNSYNKADGGAYYSSNTYTTYPAEMTSTYVKFATGRYYNGKFIPGEKYLYVVMK